MSPTTSWIIGGDSVTINNFNGQISWLARWPFDIGDAARHQLTLDPLGAFRPREIVPRFFVPPAAFFVFRPPALRQPLIRH